MKTNIKLRVTPEQSEAVQKICFTNSLAWMDGKDTPMYLNFEYLFIESNNIWCRNVYDHSLGPETEGYTEVDADLFIRTNGTCEESIDIVDNSSNNKSKEDMFKQYGFEVPDFDCTILAKVDHNYVGYITDSNAVIALSWYLNGTGYVGITCTPKYNLTPIKKPWYETCKFPVLVWNADSDLIAIETRKDYNNSYLSICRPLSHADIDRLKQDF